MTKWADYCIFKCKHSEDNVHITHVKAFKDIGEKLAGSATYERNTIVEAIESGTSIITVTESSSGDYIQGSPVRVVVINDKKFIKTDQNDKECDNLGNLPTF